MKTNLKRFVSDPSRFDDLTSTLTISSDEDNVIDDNNDDDDDTEISSVQSRTKLKSDGFSDCSSASFC